MFSFFSIQLPRRLAVLLATILVPVWLALFGGVVEANGQPTLDAVAHGHANQKVLSELSPDHFEKRVRPFIKNFCLQCHSGADGEGGVNLSQFETLEQVGEDLESWADVLQAIEQKEMPPSGASQPKPEARTQARKAITELIAGANSGVPSLGRLRRLNRVEYENTIRDLFRLSRDCFSNPSRIVQTTDYFQPATGRMPRSVFAVSYFFNSHRRHSDLPGVSNLPVDPPVEHGFANDQDALSLSPYLLEIYLELANSVLSNREFSQISGLWDSMFADDDSLTKSESVSRGHRHIKTFLPRAFRRHVSESDVKIYLDLFDAEFAAGNSYSESMKTTVSAMLVSPSFLFRHEFLPLNSNELSVSQVRQIRSYAMASRLSYFLWGSMPDDQLFQAAREGRLSGTLDLERQVKRMMKHVRVKALATNFGMEWLKISKVASSVPDKTLFPKYYKNKVVLPPPAVSMMIEQLLFFEAIMVENRSILEFIKSDFGYLNRQLMNWYEVDIEKSVGYSPPLESFEDFYRVKWNNDHRGGVISAGATLVSTSTTTRTSPVYRGAWILDVIFNSPPPPAPADVPALEPEDGNTAQGQLNVREKLEQHRLDAACASCHARIDPLGFALESFDAVGRWRTNYETGDAIDASGEIDGTEFAGPARFKDVIASENSRFVKAFVEHTLKYALGRQLHYSDEAEIRRVAKSVVEEDHRFGSVIKHVVLSELFQRFEEVDSLGANPAAENKLKSTVKEQ